MFYSTNYELKPNQFYRTAERKFATQPNHETMSSAMLSAVDLANITRDARVRKYECIETIVEATAEVARHRIREAAERGENSVILLDLDSYMLIVDYKMDQRNKIRQGCTAWWCNALWQCSSCATQLENLNELINKVKALSHDNDGKFAWVKYLNQHLMINSLSLHWVYDEFSCLNAQW